MTQNENRHKNIRSGAVKSRRKQKPGRFFVCLLIFLIFCAVIGLLLFVAFKISVKVSSEPQKVKYVYSIDENGKKKEYKSLSLKTSDYCRDGIYYADLQTLCDMLGLRYVGDYGAVTVLDQSSGEYITFTVNSRYCVINGAKCQLSNAPTVIGSSLCVPCDVFSQYCSAISSVYDGESHTFTVNCDSSKIASGFTVLLPEPIGKIDRPEGEDADSGKSETKYTFTADLSAYEEYMNPDDSEPYLILVNRDNPLASTYVPANLTNVADTRKDGRATQKMCLYAEKALEAFLIEARANGFTDVTVTSAFRDYSYQNTLFNQYTQKEMKNDSSLTKEQAEAIVATYSSRPGTSEHQSGLCCDMHNLSSASAAFAKQPAAQWLAENCYKFGFILRYPEGKQDKVCNITYEPWHFRYVGRYHAERMHELDMCLEEYVEYLGKNK